MSTTFGFVVLNYVNHGETVECVESIRRLPGDAYRIVVVDNASPNDSYRVLSEHFASDPRITVLQSGRNGGYSFGNNVGIDALRRAGIDDVIIATSDTRVEDDRLLEKCAAANAAGAAVVGPYIRDLNGAAQNPLEARLTLRYIASVFGGRAWAALKGALVRSPLRRRLQIGLPASVREDAPTTPTDVYMVHGAFLYLSGRYLERFPRLDEDLFMYGEEDLLAWNCLRGRLRCVYDPSMLVHHREQQSTPGGYHPRMAVDSVRKLRAKIGFARLVYAYLAARGR